MNENGEYTQYTQGSANMNQQSSGIIQGWSWGAFMFNIIWGLGNKCYLSLLCLVPGLNLIWAIVCGVKGHEWSYNSGTFETVAEYKAAQDTWDRAGKICFFISLGCAALSLILGLGLGLTAASLVSSLS